MHAGRAGCLGAPAARGRLLRGARRVRARLQRRARGVRAPNRTAHIYDGYLGVVQAPHPDAPPRHIYAGTSSTRTRSASSPSSCGSRLRPRSRRRPRAAPRSTATRCAMRSRRRAMAFPRREKPHLRAAPPQTNPTHDVPSCDSRSTGSLPRRVLAILMCAPPPVTNKCPVSQPARLVTLFWSSQRKNQPRWSSQQKNHLILI